MHQIKSVFLTMLNKNIDSIVAALLGITAVFLLTQHGGVGISPDSIYYISAAYSVKQGQGFLQFDDSPFVLFPVMYPIFLLLVNLISTKDIVVIAPLMNAILFGFTIFLSGVIVEKMNFSKVAKWITLAILVLSPSLLEIYSMLWSETLFIVEILIFIWFCNSYFNKASFQNLIGLAIITSIAAVTRLAGVTLIISGALLILLQLKNSGGKQWKHLFVYGLLASFLLGLNLIRNYLVASSFTGVRQKGDTSLLTNIKYFGDVMGNWFLFSKLPHFNALVVGILFFICIHFIFIYTFLKNKRNNTLEKIMTCFVLVYSLFILISATLSKYETINNRLLAPIFITLILSVGFYLFRFIQSIKFSITKFAYIVLLCGLSVGVIFNYYKEFVAMYSENKEGGIGGYSDDDWVYSDLLLSLKKDNSIFNKGIPVYSNASHAVYFFTKKHLLILPETKHKEDLQQFYTLPQHILIWLNNEDNPAIEDLEEIKKHKNLTLLKQYKDGFIYVCTPK